MLINPTVANPSKTNPLNFNNCLFAIEMGDTIQKQFDGLNFENVAEFEHFCNLMSFFLTNKTISIKKIKADKRFGLLSQSVQESTLDLIERYQEPSLYISASYVQEKIEQFCPIDDQFDWPEDEDITETSVNHAYQSIIAQFIGVNVDKLKQLSIEAKKKRLDALKEDREQAKAHAEHASTRQAPKPGDEAATDCPILQALGGTHRYYQFKEIFQELEGVQHCIEIEGTLSFTYDDSFNKWSVVLSHDEDDAEIYLAIHCIGNLDVPGKGVVEINRSVPLTTNMSSIIFAGEHQLSPSTIAETFYTWLKKLSVQALAVNYLNSELDGDLSAIKICMLPLETKNVSRNEIIELVDQSVARLRQRQHIPSGELSLGSFLSMLASITTQNLATMGSASPHPILFGANVLQNTNSTPNHLAPTQAPPYLPFIPGLMNRAPLPDSTGLYPSSDADSQSQSSVAEQDGPTHGYNLRRRPS